MLPASIIGAGLDALRSRSLKIFAYPAIQICKTGKTFRPAFTIKRRELRYYCGTKPCCGPRAFEVDSLVEEEGFTDET
jgi:hypothetical protein